MSINIEEFKYILSGCRTIIDALYFAELYSKDKSEDNKNLIISMVYGEPYNNIMDLSSLREILNNMTNVMIENNDNVNIYINDVLQTRIFIRISNIINKKCTKVYTKKNKSIKKYCPHCSRKYISSITSEYVICGLEDEKNGFNWDGCGKDWCFKCEKKLCKIWSSDKLFLNINRCHDEECCKIHSKLNKNNYLFDYCQCKNLFVNRLK
jgi:hypothetical protein